ncbi:LysR family transcriptional regulator [Paraburkholderia caballeronis]|nr:LysR family transcriptional regulator [Paraburkholderia caballeronis]TDV09173.1 LysR family transcriptional regulator [Paraburkholderia caballeronis]TDV20293.1 LysR family transcriptional regulator [Paraburkholderia caballeronis]TDV33954.1 LysR family transcriptional regulator [Paraburkholderia caballeronis]
MSLPRMSQPPSLQPGAAAQPVFNQPNFDIAALRSLAAGIDLGSFAKAADRVARSSSAVSAQIRKLEEQAGLPLFVKSGRGLALTDAGHTMLRYAKRIIELNDEAATAVRGANLDGWVRIGLQEDFGEAILPGVLGRFARAHPKVRIEARVARNAELLEGIDANRLDLALLWGDAASAALAARDGIVSEEIAHAPMRWIGAAEPDEGATPFVRVSDEPLPLVAFDRPCRFFGAATAALDRAGVPWRVAFTTPSLAGLWAAAAAGLGLTVRSRYGLPASLRQFDGAPLGLPELPSLPLVLLRRASSATPTVCRLAEITGQSVRDATAAFG